MRKAYAYVTADPPWWDVTSAGFNNQFDPDVLEDDINEVTGFYVTSLELVNRRTNIWKWGDQKEADVWFRISDDSWSKLVIKNKLRDAVKAYGRHDVAIRYLEIKEVTDDSWETGERPPGAEGEGEMPTWALVGITILSVVFVLGMLNMVLDLSQN